MKHTRFPGHISNQRLLQPFHQKFFGKVNANEHHFALTYFVRLPRRAQITAHDLVNALKDDLAVSAFHVQHAFVAQHSGPIIVDDSAQELLETGRVERPFSPIHETFHVIIVVVVMAMLVRRMIARPVMIVIV